MPNGADADHVLALCEASADTQAATTVRRIIDDQGLPPAVKAAFFQELRGALEDPTARALAPYAVMQRFMDGPGRKYIGRGEQMGPALPADAEGYVREVLAVALRDGVSRILIVPSGTALYRGAELVGVVPPNADLFPELYQYCCAVAGLAGNVREAACAVAGDGTLLPPLAAGVKARLQIVSNGRVSGLQLVL